MQTSASIQPRTSLSKFAKSSPKVRIEIRKNIGNLALEWHPHLNADISTATEKFREVGEAYSTITGEAKEPMDLFREFFHTGDPFAAMHDKDPLHAEDLKEDAPPQSLDRKLSERCKTCQKRFS